VGQTHDLGGRSIFCVPCCLHRNEVSLRSGGAMATASYGREVDPAARDSAQADCDCRCYYQRCKQDSCDRLLRPVIATGYCDRLFQPHPRSCARPTASIFLGCGDEMNEAGRPISPSPTLNPLLTLFNSPLDLTWAVSFPIDRSARSASENQ